jgi:hypothetical protein
MADSKITALDNLTAADPVNDMLPIVDVSDTIMAASGTTKRISVNNILSSSPTASGALTVTGLVTAGSATITGDLTVDTSTLVVDSTNDRVGIGTATPIAGSKLDVRSAVGTGIEIQSLNVVDTSALAINNGGGLSMGYVFLAPSTVIARAGCIKTIKENATDGNYASAMVFGVTANGVATAERMRLDSTGNVKIANGNVVMSTSGKGIDFSAVTGGTGTATGNVLNDYEEGTWTGSLLGVTTNPTVPVTATGSYTKVGRIVRISIQFSNVSTVGASGQLTVSGIPFTNSSIAAIGNAFIGNSIVTITGPVFAAVGSGASSNVDLICQLSTGDTTTANHSAGTGKYLTINTVYTV